MNLIKYDKKGLNQYLETFKNFRAKTPREILKANHPSFAVIEKELGADKAVAIAFAQVSTIKKYFDVEMSEETISLLVEEILSDNKTRMISPTDLSLAIKRAAKTEEVYNRLDFNSVWKWIERYIRDRHIEKIKLKRQIEQEEARKAEELVEPAPMPEELRKKIANLFQENKEEIIARKRDLGE